MRGPYTGVVSTPLLKSIPFTLLRKLQGIPLSDRGTMEDAYRSLLLKTVASSEHLDNIVLLAMDMVHTPSGRALPEKTGIYTSNRYLFECAASSDRILPGASVHPFRRDALDRLTACAEKGAVLNKWIPSHMGFDPMDKRLAPFYRKLADLGLPLLTHTGTEHLLADHEPAGIHVARLRRALDEGVTVIAAHSGGLRAFSTAGIRAFAAYTRSYPNLYGDTAAMANPWRSSHLRKLLDWGLEDRLLHGSDFPVSLPRWMSLFFVGFSGYEQIRNIRNPLDRDFLVKQIMFSKNR